MGAETIAYTFGSNAINRTKQYKGIRAAEDQSQMVYDQVLENLAKMRETYSDELAGKSTASELEARNQGINDLAKSQAIAQEQYAQALARSGVSSSGQAPTDIVARGLGQIGNEYTSGISDIDKALALAADRRKSAVEAAMLDYETKGMDQVAQMDAQIEGMKQGLRSTELSGGTNWVENIGNIIEQNPSAAIGAVVGGLGNMFGGNYNIGAMTNQGGLSDLSSALGVDLAGMLDAGKQVESEYIYENPNQRKVKRTYEYDRFGNRTGYTDEVITPGKTNGGMTKPQAQTYLRKAFGDKWDVLAPRQQEEAVKEYLATGALPDIERLDSVWNPFDEKGYELSYPSNTTDSTTNKNRPNLSL